MGQTNVEDNLARLSKNLQEVAKKVGAKKWGSRCMADIRDGNAVACERKHLGSGRQSTGKNRKQKVDCA